MLTRTLSEICFPVLSGKITFAVINIESNVPHAFDYDIKYIQGICNAIGHYYSNSLFKNDKDLLRQRLLEFDGRHELRQFCDLEFFDETAKGILNDTIFRYSKYGSNMLSCGERSFGELVSEIRNWIDHSYRVLLEEKLEDIKGVIKNHVPNDILISSDVFDSILAILKNLIHNIAKYGIPESDTIVMYYESPTKEISCGVFLVRLVAKAWFDFEAFRTATLSPLQMKSDRLHYGLFLVGVLTRIHGGNIFVGGDPRKGQVVLECRIPNLQNTACELII